jgi:endoglucanase
VSLGGGPVLSRGASINPKVFQALRDAAARLDIACPIQGSGRHTGTDADPMSAAGPGTAAGLISLPNRYMHSPNETVSLGDLEQAARVLAEFARTVRPDADFRPT